MRRIIGYEPLMLAVAVALMTGCSNSSSPDLADGSDATDGQYEVVHPDSVRALDAANGKPGDLPASLADNSSVVNSEREPLPVVIADGADSDSPGGYQPPSVGQTDDKLSEVSPPLNQVAGDEKTPKSNGRQPDGDDPNAPVVAVNIAELPVDAPLDDGREPSAKPIPEGERVATAPHAASTDPLNDGRVPNAKPGDESADPAQATPTTKPAAPSRATLADLPKAIRDLDKDADGQIGLYEWPREKLAEFKAIDSNKDGFLTPAELVAGQKKPSDKKPTDTSAENADSKDESKDDSSADDKSTPGS